MTLPVTALAALLGLAAVAGGAIPERRPVTTPASGWVRLTLDEAAQAEAGTAWLGDEAGQPIPYLREAKRAAESRPVPVTDIVSGRSATGESTVEFTLTAEPGASGPLWQVDLATTGETGWVARVHVTRRRGDGTWLRLDDRPERHVYDFGGTDQRLRVSLPRDADRYRLTLETVAGSAPNITHVSASREIRVAEILRPVRVETRALEDRPGDFLLQAPVRLRVREVELDIDGSFAPVTVRVTTREPGPDPKRPDTHGIVLRHALLWQLPALSTAQTRIAFAHGELVDNLVLHLPPELRVTGARWAVAEETWLFPAEAGQRIYLYTGGISRRAPGDLARLTLPAIDASLPTAALGAPEPNPHIEPESWWARLEKLFPWFIALAVAGVAVIALRLLRKPSLTP